MKFQVSSCLIEDSLLTRGEIFLLGLANLATSLAISIISKRKLNGISIDIEL